MAKRRKQNATEVAYSKQLRRIKQFIRRAEKRGFLFDDDVISQKPKRITKASVRKLEKITPEKLYKKSVYGGEASYGEVVSGTEGAKLERSLRSKKSAETRKRRRERTDQGSNKDTRAHSKINEDPDFFANVVISNWLNQLDTCMRGEAYLLLKAWMSDLIAKYGKHEVAVMVEKGAEEGTILTWDVVYKGNLAVQYIASLEDLLPGDGVLYKGENVSKDDFMKQFADAMEELEVWEIPF